MKILPVILSGGFGTRLWPLSRQAMPKQFMHDLFAKGNLFTKALKLVSDKELFLPPMAITHQNHKFFAIDSFISLGIEPTKIILEPQAKNTAMAILIAAIEAKKIFRDDNVNILVLPSDHLISPKGLFIESIENAMQVVDKKIITFGVKPVFPSTGYGYIKNAEKISEDCFSIDEFVEKPDSIKAEEYIKAGNYFWNAGIFLFKSKIYIDETTKYLEDQIEVAENAISNANDDKVFCEIRDVDYEEAKDISIDYGILEKSDNVATTEMKADWSDVGDFKAVYDIKDKDKNGNVVDGNAALYDTKNSLIHSQKNMIACLGVDNIVAIESDDVFLIADKSRAQDIKKITQDLLSKNKEEVKLHKKGFRPWGYYQTLSEGKDFKVKRILVKPNSAISLQLHNKRSEHWVVIKGVAMIQKEEEIFELKTGESTFIPMQTKHRIMNQTDVSLEIIEVQMGSYVGEDDIVRIEDDYGRAT